MCPPVVACSSRRCWYFRGEDEKAGCFDNLLPLPSAGPCLNSHQACLSVYIIVHTYCTCQSLTKSLCFASPFGNTRLLYPWIPWHSSIFMLFYSALDFKGKNVYPVLPWLRVQDPCIRATMLYILNQNLHTALHYQHTVVRHTHRALNKLLITSMNSLKRLLL